MKNKRLMTGLVTLLLTLSIQADQTVRLVTDRGLELTGFQDPRPYTPAYDLRNDFVMVYGTHANRIPAIQSWVDEDYVPHLMTGISWGEYQDYNDMNGRDIMSLSQMDAQGREKLHGRRIPYVVAKRRPGDVATSLADPTRAAERMGWKAERNLRDMCADAWAWQRSRNR